MLKRNLAALAVLTLPFSSVLAIGTFTNLSMVFAVLYLSIKKYAFEELYGNEFAKALGKIVFFALWFVYVLSYFNPKLSYYLKDIRTYVFLLIYFVAVYNAILEYGVDTISRWLYYGLMISMFYAIADFFLSNFMNIFIDTYVYRYDIPKNPGKIVGLYRARGTTSESGFFAYYLNAIVPLALIYAFKSRKAPFFFSLTLVSFILAFSAAGIAVLIASVFLVLLFTRQYRRLFVITLLAVFAVALLLLYFRMRFPFIDVLLSKLTLNRSISSVAIRLSALSLGIGYLTKMFESPMGILHFFIGYGSGYFEDMFGSGLSNFYLIFIVEKGVLLFLLLVGTIVTILRKTLRINNREKTLILYSLLASLTHLFLIGNFYELYILYSVAFALAVWRQQQDEKSVTGSPSYQFA